MTKELASSNDALIEQQAQRAQMLARSSFFFIVTWVYLTIVPRTRCLFCSEIREIVGERYPPKKRSRNEESGQKEILLNSFIWRLLLGKVVPRAYIVLQVFSIN